MDLKVEIRRNSDGTIAVDVFKDCDFNTYWWEEGNGACDCNRELYFLTALGTPAEDADCGAGRYSVRLCDNDSGEVLYNELEA